MRVTVTGANGFIGRHALRELSDNGHRVVSITRGPEQPEGAEEHIHGDVLEAATWQDLAGDAIVHLAGLADASQSYGRPLDYNTVNSVGTLLGLEAARRLGSRFLLASSQRVYLPGPRPVTEDAPLAPVDPYGYSKLVAERWVEMYRRVYKLPATVLRFFSVYGPGQLAGSGASGVVALFTARALRGQTLVVHNRSWRDFTFVHDVTRGIRLALENERAIGETYNIATGVATTTQELAEAVVAITGSRGIVRVESGDLVGESYVANVTKAHEHLGYRAGITLAEGLERHADWLRGQR